MYTDYDYTRESHTVNGARRALSVLLPKFGMPTNSLLDVGCGPGAWLAAAEALGVAEVLGVDGTAQSRQAGLVAPERIIVRDIAQPFNFDRRFDLVLCLEAAEHIAEASSDVLVDSICRHGDRILFSAAVPGQPGQHHVNCQWPAYWQNKFNAKGFACADWPRWSIWDDVQVEPHYRQNMLIASRSDEAGAEARIPGVVHPALCTSVAMADAVSLIENGSQPIRWYLSISGLGLASKVARRVKLR